VLGVRGCVVGLAAASGVAICAMPACGSRTDLDVPTQGTGARDGQGMGDDAGEDAAFDATFDAGFDATTDASEDAPFDAELDAPDDVVLPIDAELDAPSDAIVPAEGGVGCAGGVAPTAYLLDESGDIYVFDPASVSVQFLGTPSCNDETGPFTLSVSREGKAYVLYSDWQIFEVDLATFHCSSTPFQLGQLGLSSELAIAVSRASGVEKLLVSGVSDNSGAPILAESNLTSFVLTKVGDILPVPPSETFPIDMQADLTGHLYGLSDDGFVLEMDVNTGAVETTGEVPVNPDDSWAIMAYETDVFAFSGSTVFQYDFATHTSSLVGDVGIEVIGASALPCSGAQ
jgi:hypothetical protein